MELLTLYCIPELVNFAYNKVHMVEKKQYRINHFSSKRGSKIPCNEKEMIPSPFGLGLCLGCGESNKNFRMMFR